MDFSKLKVCSKNCSNYVPYQYVTSKGKKSINCKNSNREILRREDGTPCELQYMHGCKNYNCERMLDRKKIPSYEKDAYLYGENWLNELQYPREMPLLLQI